MDCLRSENLKEVRAYSSFFDATLIALGCQSVGVGQSELAAVNFKQPVSVGGWITWGTYHTANI
jgi:hypothetical protein